MGYLIAAGYFTIFWFLLNTKGVSVKVAVFWPILLIKWFVLSLVELLFIGRRN